MDEISDVISFDNASPDGMIDATWRGFSVHARKKVSTSDFAGGAAGSVRQTL
jgi:hypothetical protein